MDAVADKLTQAFINGEKSLVFVRRVRSVDELAERLNHVYDSLLFPRLERELPKRHRSVLAAATARISRPSPAAPGDRRSGRRGRRRRRHA